MNYIRKMVDIYLSRLKIKKITSKAYKYDLAEDFNNELLEKCDNLYIKGVSIKTLMRHSFSMNRCHQTARYLSHAFDDCYLCEGVLNKLNYNYDGQKNLFYHSWVEVGEKVYDTTFGKIMDRGYNSFGAVWDREFYYEVFDIDNVNKANKQYLLSDPKYFQEEKQIKSKKIGADESFKQELLLCLVCAMKSKTIPMEEKEQVYLAYVDLKQQFENKNGKTL